MDRIEEMQYQIAMETNWLTRNNIKPTALDGVIPPGELKTREEVAARIKRDMTAFMAESMRSSSTKDAIMNTIHDISKYYAKNAGVADQYKQFTKKDALRAFKIDEEATKWSYKIVFSNTDDKYINMGISQYVWEYVVRKFRPHFMNYLGSISVTKSGRTAINFRIKLKDADDAMEAFFQSGWEKLDDAKRAPLDKKIEFWYTSKFKKHDDFCKSTKDLAQVISGYPNMKDHKFTYKMIAGIAVAISDEYIVIGQGDLEKGAINIEAFWIKPDKLDQYIASSMSKFKKFNSSKVV